MTTLLCALFFASGTASLIFESLWFRQAGLAFGNSVWASSLVLSGFMGGLALGNAVAVRHGSRFRRPVVIYALAEIAIAVTGVALVFMLPALGALLSPMFRPLLDHGLFLNVIRLGLAFVLLLVPSSAMGVTLPALVTAATTSEGDFSRALGRLYGWNTLGAVAGAVIGETYLVGALGVRGTAGVAAAISVAAAFGAMRLSKREVVVDPWTSRRTHSRRSSGRPWLAAAFLSGFSLLALEVVWFRLLVLFVKAHSTAFPLMLAVVLTGIGGGSLAASAWLRRMPGASRHTPVVAFGTGLAVVLCYAAFPTALSPFGLNTITKPSEILQVAVPLMLPVATASGGFFTLLATPLRERAHSDTEAAGLLVLVNTIGAAAGSFLAGFVLLPVLGVERSLFVIALIYGAIGSLLLSPVGARRGLATVAGVIFVLGLAAFPVGAMDETLVRIPVNRWSQGEPSRQVVEVREGLTETVIYFERVLARKPVSYVMLTNSFSMSTTGYGVRRYQKLYVYWPMAVHPDLQSALLIGYGVGNTAKAMTDSPGLRSIDIVDLSRDILDLNRVVYPNDDGSPLRDSRVRVHIEDGRYFLQTTDKRFDLITGEPPPPGIAGVEHLYSREYFQLMYARLAEGGLVTYWLPLSDLSDVSAKAILGAFCAVFDDCSLWNGSGTNLMLVGSRHLAGSVSEEHFTEQWRHPEIREEMRRLGVEQPEQLGALFIGDAAFVRSLVGDIPPLVDDRPKMIEAPFSSGAAGPALLSQLTDVEMARQRFEQSAFIQRVWPTRLRMTTLPFFEFQRVINAHMYGMLVPSDRLAIDDVHEILTTSSLQTPALWRLASNDDIQQVVSGATPAERSDPRLQLHLGIRLLAERDYLGAVNAFERAEQLPEIGDNAFALHIYALCMAGRTTEAEALTRGPFRASLSAGGVRPESVRQASLPPFWLWMKDTFGIDPRTDADEAQQPRE